jgi:two-component system alkaline phosphatase synthesis response regulator PhoP
MNPYRFLIIGDNESDCISLQQMLFFQGYFVDIVLTVNQAFEKNIVSYNILVIDTISNGLELYRMIKQMQLSQGAINIPILFVLKNGQENKYVSVMDKHNEVIYKPFDNQAVTKKVTQLIASISERQTSESDNNTSLVYHSLILSIASKKVMIDEQAIRLTKKEFELLKLFMENRNHLFSRKEIIARVWSSESSVSDRAIDVNIARLRDKLGIYKGNIVTRLGFGYGFEE